MPSAISQQVVGLATSTSPGLAQAGGYNILPAGIVFPFAGGSAPAGFLLCEGQELLKTTYPALYAAIGDDYATQIDPTTGVAWPAPDADKFRVPDYRGIFLRGVGTPSGLDVVARGAQQVDKTKKTAGLTATNGTSVVTGTTNIAHSHGSSSLSVVQTDLTHGHDVIVDSLASFRQQAGGGGLNGFGYSTGGDQIRGDWFRNVQAANDLGAHTHSGTAAGQSLATSNISIASGSAAAQTITLAGDNETRPINKGVAYIIKA